MIKAAGYCRVSTDSEDQANSFETQKAYFREYIRRNPEWELYEIYADDGLSGTSTRKRAAFNRMMNDAYEGKFQMIVTKEVSRFSRNILDTIAYTRELRAMGIGVIFATDRINTLEPESEMLLSYIAAQSQEESRRTSARVVWGQTRQMEKGVVFGRSLLGYDVKDGRLTVEPQGAELVRLIFHKYAREQMSTARLARYLTQEGFRTHRGNTEWSSATVIKLLKNEKYVGDLVQKKTYTPDFLTHQKRPNRGDVPLVTIHDHHEPIVSRELWDLAQERLRRGSKHGAGEWGHSNRYVFSGKIKCAQCGSSFVGRCKYLSDGTKLRRWSCATAVRRGRGGCDIGKLVRDDDAMQMLRTSVGSLPMDFDAVLRNVTELALEAVLAGQSGTQDDPARLRRELERTKRKKEAVMDAWFSGEITREDMRAFTARYDQQQTALEDQLKVLLQSAAPDASALRAAIRSELASILELRTESDVFCKTMLGSLTVYTDRHMELRLARLPHIYHFQ